MEYSTRNNTSERQRGRQAPSCVGPERRRTGERRDDRCCCCCLDHQRGGDAVTVRAAGRAVLFLASLTGERSAPLVFVRFEMAWVERWKRGEDGVRVSVELGE